MNRVFRNFVCLFFISLLFFASGCGQRSRFTIISGSENETLAPILERFGGKNNVSVEMKYKGSVDIMLDLGADTIDYDAVWPASSMWIGMGDKKYRVKNQKSILVSPVVFGIKKSVAEKLGFVGRDVKVAEILSAIKRKELTFAMTSASQSNSGASAYLGFLYALLGGKQPTKADLDNKELQDRVTSLLAGINRSSGSSGWLKELFLRGNFDAMVNYESLIIETNEELVKQGREPLYVVYPVDGLVLGDSPLGYCNRGDAEKEKLFLKLQDYLLSAPVQQEIAGLGRRVGLGGMGASYDKNVFKPEWGIQTEKILSPITLPSSDLIYQALEMYQTQFRKPSITVFCLDFSGSMQGDGERQVKDAMGLLLTPSRARQYLMQPGKNDVTIVIPFSSAPRAEWIVTGDNPDSLAALLDKIKACIPDGGTDIYTPAIKGMQDLSAFDLTKYMPAVIVMTDGKSNTGANLNDLTAARAKTGRDIPVFSVMFGEASADQLREMTDASLGTLFDGRKDLVTAFRKVKGYN